MNAIATVEANPVAVLTDAKVYSDFYAQMKGEVDEFVPDLSTVTGRKAIASLAYKVTRTKTAIDEAGKKLNEEARAQINAVDAQRRKIREELDGLAELARKPLTEWETAEEERKASCDAILNRIGIARIVTHDDTPETVTARLEQTRSEAIVQEQFGDGYQFAVDAKASAIESLEAAAQRLAQEAADRAELARLRREQEEREAQEFAKKEEARMAAQAEAEREAAARRDEASEAARLAEIAAAEERSREAAKREAEREAQAKIAAAEAEAKRLRKIDDDRKAAEKKAADEQAARDADRAHRGKVMGAAKDAIVALGIDAEAARKIVLAIVAGEIPNVTLRF